MESISQQLKAVIKMIFRMELLRAAQGQGVGYLLHIPYNNET